ncbi:hypothetical protein JTE90_004932 [Oedothorax gibbosus]|uniref:Uncharacterized protein n=1 Tax=Oedothorax gibbosus TaxID=931172 RepID=A0AAV6TW57_9ARAC|nr:hypothetical protein JTE90_004932 [Oedothorax gibbosus]
MSGAVQRWRTFFHNFAPVIIMVPGLVIAHWVWFRLQENPAFVPRDKWESHPLKKKKDDLVAFFSRSSNKKD